MKANELMIGDWVMTTSGETCKIIMVGQHSPCYTNCHTDGDGMYWPNDLSPIPLTREILEKNGWKEAVLRHWNIEEDFALEKGEDGNMFWFLRGVSLVCSLNFVHELQHALKLCRIEKEIKL